MAAVTPATPPASVRNFEQIYAEFGPRLFTYIYRMVRNRELAEDLTQDVFLKAFKDLPNHDDMRHLSAWLYRIAANTTFDALRRRKLIAWLPLSLFNEDHGVLAGIEALEGEPADTDSMDRHTDRIVAYEAVTATLAKLDTKERACIVLSDVRGLTMAQCAKHIGISDTAFKMRLMRARRHFMHAYVQEAD